MFHQARRVRLTARAAPTASANALTGSPQA
jgi:hypothetical protein